MKRTLPICLIAIPAIALTVHAQDADINAEVMAPGEANEPLPWPDFLGDPPVPGRYELTISFENFRMPDLPGGKLGGQGMEGFAPEIETTFICVTDDVERVDLAEEIGDEDCNLSDVEREGEAFSFAMACRPQSGERMDLRVSGSAGSENADALMQMRIKDKDVGLFSMDMRAAMQRVGDCTGEEEPIGDAPL